MAPGASYTPQVAPLATEVRDTFLAHFPTNKRSTVANWFLEPIRELHATDPRFVVVCVLGRLKKRLGGQWCTGQEQANIEYAIEMIEAHTNDALQCAAYYLQYSALPEAEREAMKRQRREEGRAAYMAERPPSDRQLDYLRSLRYAGTPPATMAEASQEIDRILRRKRGAR